MKDINEMQIAYNSVHFGLDKKPKTLRVSKVLPEMDEKYGNVKEAGVVFSILKKDASTGFSMTVSELSSLIYALRSCIEELWAQEYKLTAQIKH